jgi:hypothetical protein
VRSSNIAIKEQLHLLGTIPQLWIFSAEAILGTAELLADEYKKAAKLISMALNPPKISLVSLQHCFHGFFGILNESHGIYPGHRLGFDASEPQITRGLGSFINPLTHGKLGEVRIKTFLLALLKGKTNAENLIASLQSSQSFSFTVEAEKLVPKANRRIDLFIAWNPCESGQFEYGVLIEAKFNHKVTTGQLPTYKQYAKTLFSKEENAALVLLTLDGSSSNKNKDWLPVQWLSLMSRWERMLDDTDKDFSYFRHFIWKKIGR